MRPVLHSDVLALAQYLLPLDENDRPKAAHDAIARAHAADLYRKRTGVAHRLWGNGSIAAALVHGTPVDPMPTYWSPTALAAVAAAAEALIDWRAGQGRRGGVHGARSWRSQHFISRPFAYLV